MSVLLKRLIGRALMFVMASVLGLASPGYAQEGEEKGKGAGRGRLAVVSVASLRGRPVAGSKGALRP